MNYSHLILDDFGEPLRGFRSKKEALWFIENKPGLTIQATGYKSEPVKTVNENDSQYQLAMDTCKPCLL